MTNANTEPPEVSLASQSGNAVAQSVVASVTAVSLEARLPGVDIEFVMGNKHVTGFDSVVMRGACDRASAVIHISAGYEQPEIVASHVAATDFAYRILVCGERYVEAAGKLTHKECTGVMPSAFILCVRIAKPDNESDAGHEQSVLAALTGIAGRLIFIT